MAERKIPQRTCVCCRTTHDKRDLLRVVKTPQGTVEVDTTGKVNGRGCYLCKDPACAARVIKTKPLSKFLGVPVGEEVYEKLKEVLLG